jgi:hypothetical protein
VWRAEWRQDGSVAPVPDDWLLDGSASLVQQVERLPGGSVVLRAHDWLPADCSVVAELAAELDDSVAPEPA